jgi:predicted RND superfamily exporter protein
MPGMMAKVVAEMGPSIGITSITNGLAFGIGIFAPSTLMSSFCLCTTMAIFFDFLFELLVFAPCLPLIQWRMDNVEGQNESAMHKIR